MMLDKGVWIMQRKYKVLDIRAVVKLNNSCANIFSTFTQPYRLTQSFCKYEV